MPMRKDLTRIESNPVLRSSRAKIKRKKDARDGGQYTIPSNQSASDVKVLDI